jgi:hypothetical protein
VLELGPARAAVVRCFGERRALDAFPSLGAMPARIAADELWLVAPRASASELAQRATSYLTGADPDGFVLEHGEAWAVWTISGSGLPQAFARLADFPLPAGRVAFAQGAVAQLPAKILVQGDRLHVIVPVQLAHHVPDRFREACEDLEPILRPERELALEREPDA